MSKSSILIYLSLPLPLFWWGWFDWWVALPCTLGLVGILVCTWKKWEMWEAKVLLLCTLMAFIWTYLAGVGGFRPQHFDYFKHNLIINNLVRYDWPVRYADGGYLCYYHAYYLPAALLAKYFGGISVVHYYIFGWTWLGLSLLFILLCRVGGWKFLLFFMFFNSPEAILLVYEAFKSPNSIGYTLADLWANDHTIELIQTPGGLMFPSHVESFTAAPQHALPAWLATGLFLEYQVSNTKYQNAGGFTVYCVLFTILLYWSPLVAIGFLPFIVFYSLFQRAVSSFQRTRNLSPQWKRHFLRQCDKIKQHDKVDRHDKINLLLVILMIPALIFYAGHVHIKDIHGWWWTFLKNPHEYALLGAFLVVEVGFWGIFIGVLEKKYAILKQDFRLILLALSILLVLALYRYGYFNDLSRRASLPAALLLCWGVYKYLLFLHCQLSERFLSSIKRIFSFILYFLFFVLIISLPLKHHLRWLTKQPYTAVVDKKIIDFTPYSIHYLSRYHWGEFDVAAQYLGKYDSWYVRYFAPTTPKLLKQTTRAFYYWKSVFQLSDYETQALKTYNATRLYIKFFDVDWDNATQRAVPKAVIQFKQNPPLVFVPTVFITNRTLEKLSWGGIDELAVKVSQKIKTIAKSPSLSKFDEIQIDCDWTLSTRTKYFRLLQKLQTTLPLSTQLSATIRLHQIKFYRTTGVPPVARGMLMYYNMDDWKNPRTQNSILDLTAAGRYADYISDYPLDLDVVLPVFSWAVVYRNNKFLIFINHLNHRDLQQNNTTFKRINSSNQYIALRDTIAFGLSVHKGDVFRIEESTFQDLKISSQTLSQEIQNRRVTFALYHLDSLNLVYYEKDSLQQIFQSFY